MWSGASGSDSFGEVERLAYSDAITITYHPQFAYPIVIDADPVQTAIDEELLAVVSGFEVLGN